MPELIHRTPSAGSVIKKLAEAYPELTASAMTSIVRQALFVQGNQAGEFSSAEVIDEAKAMRLAEASLSRPCLSRQ